MRYNPSRIDIISILTILVKAGYPPRSLTLISQLPVSSLGLQKGDQIIVTQLENSVSPLTRQTSPPKIPPSTILGVNPPISSRSPPQAKEAIGDEYVDTDGGVLIHRVSYISRPKYNL